MSDECTEQDIKKLISMLPVYHEYADKKSILLNGKTLHGAQEHEEYCSLDLRIRTKRRCTLFSNICATHKGNHVALTKSLNIVLAMCATSDWQAQNLHIEKDILILADEKQKLCLPRIGPYYFNFNEYISSIFKDFCLGLCALQHHATSQQQKLYLKIVPLGIGPSVQTRQGNFLMPHLMFLYKNAMLFALQMYINDTWVHTLDLVDNTSGTLLTPNYSNSKINIVTGLSRDILEFEDLGKDIQAAILCPTDSFEHIGGFPIQKNIGSSIANNSSNLREKVYLEAVEYCAFTV